MPDAATSGRVHSGIHTSTSYTLRFPSPLRSSPHRARPRRRDRLSCESGLENIERVVPRYDDVEKERSRQYRRTVSFSRSGFQSAALPAIAGTSLIDLWTPPTVACCRCLTTRTGSITGTILFVPCPVLRQQQKPYNIMTSFLTALTAGARRDMPAILMAYSGTACSEALFCCN